MYSLRVLILGTVIWVSGTSNANGAPDLWSTGSQDAAREMFEQGRKKLDALDFEGASTSWTYLADHLPEGAHLLRARAYLSLSTALERWYFQHPDRQHLLDARGALIAYARETDYAYAGQPQSLLAEYRRFCDRLLRLDTAINPTSQRIQLFPTFHKEPEQVLAPSASTQLEMPSSYSSRHYWMMVGGGAITALGVVALVMSVIASERKDDAATLGWLGASATLASVGIIVGYFGYRRNTISIAASSIPAVGSTRLYQRDF